jgi:hypothetical protein
LSKEVDQWLPISSSISTQTIHTSLLEAKLTFRLLSEIHRKGYPCDFQMSPILLKIADLDRIDYHAGQTQPHAVT